jgi:hypothetical protein
MDFFTKDFWVWITDLAWWQGFIILITVLITVYIGKNWKNVFLGFGNAFKKFISFL